MSGQDEARALETFGTLVAFMGPDLEPGALGFRADDVDDSKIPKTLDELNIQISRAFDISISVAMDLGIPVIGSIGGTYNRRVIVLERTAYKEVTGTSGTVYQYGYALRLCVTVSQWTAQSKVSLPWLAASAEVGNIRAAWQMQVIGLAGPKIDEVSITPTELNVETFVLAKQSLEALIGAVRDPKTVFAAVVVGKKAPEGSVQHEYTKALARSYALGRLGVRSTLQRALDDVSSTDALFNDTVTDAYREVADITDPTAKPTKADRKQALELLDGVTVAPR